MKFTIEIKECEETFSPHVIEKSGFPGEPPVTRMDIEEYTYRWETELQYQNYFRAYLIDESSEYAQHRSVKSPFFFRGDKGSHQERNAVIGSLMGMVAQVLSERIIKKVDNQEG